MERPRYVLVTFQHDKRDNFKTDTSLFDHSKIVTNKFGRLLFDFVSNNNIAVAVVCPTFFRRGSRPDILDMALGQNISHNILVEGIPELSSDHIPVLLDMSGDAVLSGSSSSTFNSWTAFQEKCDQYITPDLFPSPTSCDQLEDAAERLTSCISRAVVESSYSKAIPRNRWFPPDIRLRIQERRKALKTYHRTLCPRERERANNLSNALMRRLDEF